MAVSSKFVIINTLELLGSGNSPLIAINAGSQLPLKLTPSNFPSWHAQLTSLLIGYDLQGYHDGTTICPSRTLSTSTSSAGSSSASVFNPAFWHWLRQDKLILHAILASLFKLFILLIATSTTTHDAWSKLQRFPKFREIAAPIRARETSIKFEELYDMLVGHESYLHLVNASNSILVATTNTTQHCTTASTFNHNQSSSPSSYVQHHPNSSRYNRREQSVRIRFLRKLVTTFRFQVLPHRFDWFRFGSLRAYDNPGSPIGSVE
ncbi:uncharacterized protein LOC131153718 [Malania oleifera]|uniref:uncharacterized protein LOC131153718 n=1 Tax=Malania oleifera TaxID=397392 RepID=UPI0025AECD4E|nr:uncharacterized protein LOC131153718 [Malania oleifera]